MRRVVVTGATGLVGAALVPALRVAGDEVTGLGHAEIDLELPSSLTRISDLRPEVVVNAAAWADVDGCALDPRRAMRINAEGARHVASTAAAIGALVVQLSTNEVFPGAIGHAYGEEDEPGPINAYGASKLAGERAVAEAAPRHLIVRTAWVYGARRGFPARIAAAAERARSSNEGLEVVDDEWGNPTPVESLAGAIVIALQLALSGEGPKALHIAGEPPTTRCAWAREILIGMPDPPLIRPIRQADYRRPSATPPHAVLATGRARQLGIPAISWMPHDPD